jgi:hypothetical protein
MRGDFFGALLAERWNDPGTQQIKAIQPGPGNM